MRTVGLKPKNAWRMYDAKAEAAEADGDRSLPCMSRSKEKGDDSGKTLT